MIIIHAAFAMLTIVLVALVSIYSWLILKVIMHLLVVVVGILFSSPSTTATSIIESLIVTTIITLLRAFIISLLALPLVIVSLSLAT